MRLPLLVTTTVLAHSAFNGSRVNISLYALSQGASALTVGTLMSLYAALPMFLAVGFGRYVDRVGVRRPVLFATSLLVAGVALPAVAPALATLYAAAACIGTSFMAVHVCVQHTVGESSTPEERQSNFGWLALGFSISGFFGPTIAGFAIDLIGHRLTFALQSLFALAALCMLVANRRTLPHTPHESQRESHGSTLAMLGDAELRRVFITTGLLAAAWDLFVFVMPVYGTEIGLSASKIGLILGSFALATFVVRVALPWLSRHFSEWHLITATLFVAGVAYALFPVMRSLPTIATIAFLLGLGLGASSPSLLTLIYATAPPGRGAEAMGVRSVVLNASHTFLPLAFGGVGVALGMGPVFWSMAACLAAGGWFANRRRRMAPASAD